MAFLFDPHHIGCELVHIGPRNYEKSTKLMGFQDDWIGYLTEVTEHIPGAAGAQHTALCP